MKPSSRRATSFLSNTAKPNPYYAHVRRVSSSHYARCTRNDVALSVNVARYSIINFDPSFCIIPFRSILNPMAVVILFHRVLLFSFLTRFHDNKFNYLVFFNFRFWNLNICMREIIKLDRNYKVTNRYSEKS